VSCRLKSIRTFFRGFQLFPVESNQGLDELDQRRATVSRAFRDLFRGENLLRRARLQACGASRIIHVRRLLLSLRPVTEGGVSTALKPARHTAIKPPGKWRGGGQ
jgi:hypothetical protein